MGLYMGFYRDNGKENGSYSIRVQCASPKALFYVGSTLGALLSGLFEVYAVLLTEKRSGHGVSGSESLPALRRCLGNPTGCDRGALHSEWVLGVQCLGFRV